MHPRASLCSCATDSGQLSCAQILEAADSIGVRGFLCRILDMDFGELLFRNCLGNRNEFRNRGSEGGQNVSKCPDRPFIVA
jgi:hypothetical protein